MSGKKEEKQKNLQSICIKKKDVGKFTTTKLSEALASDTRGSSAQGNNNEKNELTYNRIEITKIAEDFYIMNYILHSNNVGRKEVTHTKKNK